MFSHNNLAFSRRRAVQSDVTAGGLDWSTSCHNTPLWRTHESRHRRTLHRIRLVYRCHCSISGLWTYISSCHIETNYKENITIIQTRQSRTGSDFVMVSRAVRSTRKARSLFFSSSTRDLKQTNKNVLTSMYIFSSFRHRCEFCKLQPRLIRLLSEAFLALFWRISNRCCIPNLNEEPDSRLFCSTL